MRAMSSVFVARVVGGTAAGAEVLTGTRPARGRAFPGKKWVLVTAVALLALLAAFAALIPASQAPNADHHSSLVGSTPDQSGAGAPVSQPAAPQMSEKEALHAYEKLPLSFIPNESQATDEAVRYYAQGTGYGFSFTHKGAMLSFAEGKGRGHALALDFLGAEPDATLEARQRLSGEVNYLVGGDQAKWQQGLPTHAELLYGGLWPGIDMAVRGEGGKLKYEFHLQPGASVEDVHLAYRGAQSLSVGAGGELLVQTPLGVLEDAAPVSYQRIGGERVPVESRYKLLKGDGGGYGFAVGAYDPRYPLIIDPGLDYSTFLGTGTSGGSTSTDIGYDIAVDGMGRAYVTGLTGFGPPSDFPTTPGAFDTSFNGGGDAFVTKLNASGSALVYSTFLGGDPSPEIDWDSGLGIAVDAMGRAYVTGRTSSADFPTTPGAFDTTINGGIGSINVFVTKLNAAGSALAYSTFLGETDLFSGLSIAVRDGRAYVTGDTRSPDFPTTPGAFDAALDGFQDAFVTKLNAAGSALAYSTFLGGTNDDRGEGIAVDGTGSAYVTGSTFSSDYPTTTGAFDTSFAGGFSAGREEDAFVTKLNAAGSALAYSTFLGGTDFERALGIAVDGTGSAYLTGCTYSSDYPTTPGAFDRSHNHPPSSGSAACDVFVTKLNAAASALAYSTFVGGIGEDEGLDIAVDGKGRAYLTGVTNSSNYPTTRRAFDRIFNGGSTDAFVTKLNTAGSALAYSTFLGGSDTRGGGDYGWGIAVDGMGRAYVTGQTGSSDYPTTPGAFDTSFNGGFEDVFMTKLPTG
jgi:hypothetical protein